MKKNPKVMIPRLDAATWTVIRPGWTTQAVTADKESAKVEERLPAPGYMN